MQLLLTIPNSPEWEERFMERRLNNLTKREWEVLTLMAEGLQNKQIADKLSLTIGTVEQHLKQVYAKMGACNHVEAARM